MKKTSQVVFAVIILLCMTTNLGAVVEITPRLSAGVEYTDNVRLVPDNTESDYITTVTPGITVDFSGRTAGLALSYDPSYVSYYDNSYDDYWRHAAGLDGWWQSGRNTRFGLTNTFLKSEDPIDNEDLTIRRSRNPYTRNTTSARMDYQFGAENNFYADGLYAFLNNEDPTIEDSERYGGSAGVTYWLNIRWGVDVGAEYYQDKYEFETDDAKDLVGRARVNHRFNPHFTGFLAYEHTLHRYDNIDNSDYTIYDGAVGFDYAIDPTMDLTIGVHYLVLTPDVGDDESATPVDISFTKRFQRGSISLNGSGGYNFTSLTAENLGVYQYYEASLVADYPFTRLLSGDINASYGYRDYLDTFPRREDDVARAGCGLSFQLLRWLSMRAGYTYNSVRSTIDTNEYVENRVSLMINIVPPQPYRF